MGVNAFRGFLDEYLKKKENGTLAEIHKVKNKKKKKHIKDSVIVCIFVVIAINPLQPEIFYFTYPVCPEFLLFFFVYLCHLYHNFSMVNIHFYKKDSIYNIESFLFSKG